MFTGEAMDEAGGALDNPGPEVLEDGDREIRQERPDRADGLIRRRMTDHLRAVDGEGGVAQVAQLFRLLQRRHFKMQQEGRPKLVQGLR